MGVVTDFSRRLDLGGAIDAGPVAFFYPGSSIGNFTPDEALSLLRRVRDVDEHLLRVVHDGHTGDWRDLGDSEGVADRGGSSTLPQKHNPVAAVAAIASAQRAPGLVATSVFVVITAVRG